MSEEYESQTIDGEPTVVESIIPTKHQTLTVVGVIGMIGVGKTTLLQNAEKTAKIPVFKEYVVRSILDDFINRKAHMNAFAFQAVMMHSACARLENALSLAKAKIGSMYAAEPLAVSSGEIKGDGSDYCTHAPFALLEHNFRHGRIVLHERPPLENRIFALANRMTGAIKRSEHQIYTHYVDEMLTMVKASGVPNLNVLLWAPQVKTTANMLQRGTESEQNYDQDFYLSSLHHAYFLDFLAHEKDHGYVVLDWRNWGTYDTFQKTIIRAMEEGQGHIQTCVQHTNQRVDWQTLKAVGMIDENMEPTKGNKHDKLIVGAENKDNKLYLHLNLNAYMNASRSSRGTIQSIVMSHLVRTPTKGPAANKIYVHGMTDRRHLHDPKGRYATDKSYKKFHIPIVEIISTIIFMMIIFYPFGF